MVFWVPRRRTYTYYDPNNHLIPIKHYKRNFMVPRGIKLPDPNY